MLHQRFLSSTDNHDKSSPPNKPPSDNSSSNSGSDSGQGKESGGEQKQNSDYQKSLRGSVCI